MAKTNRRKYPDQHGFLASEGLAAARAYGGRPLSSILEHLAECFSRDATVAIWERLVIKSNSVRSDGATLHPDQLDKVFEAAGIPLIGFETAPAKVRDETTAKAERFALNIGLSAAGSVQLWSICSNGIVHRRVPNPHPLAVAPSPQFDLVCTKQHYAFDEAGALVRIAAFDEVAKTSEILPIAVRMRGVQRPVTREEAYGAMASLLAAFGPLRFSLTGAGDKRIQALIGEVKSDARKMARKLRAPGLLVLRDEDSEALEVLCDAYADRFQRVQVTLERSIRQPQALLHLMGPAVACFELLFGPATRGTGETPFTRFVVRFLRELGCIYKCTTISRHLARWRNEHVRSESVHDVCTTRSVKKRQ